MYIHGQVCCKVIDIVQINKPKLNWIKTNVRVCVFVCVCVCVYFDNYVYQLTF